MERGREWRQGWIWWVLSEDVEKMLEGAHRGRCDDFLSPGFLGGRVARAGTDLRVSVE